MFPVLAAGAATGIVMDFGLVLVAAAVAAVIFQRLRLPVILGYILAGILIGPHLFASSLIQDQETVRELSELGVVFLLFAIGLEFDLKRLRQVFAPALIALLLQGLCMVLLGIQFGRFLGWDGVQSIFLGCLLSISSSMVTIKVLEEFGRLRRTHGQLAVGILIMEDILAVLLLVLLSGLAVSRRFEWNQISLVILLVAAFVVLVYVVGKLILPRTLDFLNRIGSVELMTVFTAGMVMGIGILAVRFEFSIALGAFIAGTILAENPLLEKIEHITRPFRDVFGAIFFVSVGMIIDPAVIWENAFVIIALALFVIIGKILTCWAGLFLGGQQSKSAFRAAVAKCQIAEFSFIIAELAIAEGVAGDDLMALAVGVSLVTILATPFLSKDSERIFVLMARRFPVKLRLAGRFYHDLVDNTLGALNRSRFLSAAKKPLTRLALYFLLVNGIILAASFVARGMIPEAERGAFGLTQILIWGATAFAIAPFIVAMIRCLSAMMLILMEFAVSTKVAEQFFSGASRNVIHILLTAIVVLPILTIYMTAAWPFVPQGASMIFLVVLVALLGAIFWRHLIHVNTKMEVFFLESLRKHSREIEKQKRASVLKDFTERHPWEINLKEIVLEPGSRASLKRIGELAVRTDTGCTIIAVSRSGVDVVDPEPDFQIFPGDKLTLLGNPEQLNAAAELLGEPVGQHKPAEEEGYELQAVYLSETSNLGRQTLVDGQLRTRWSVTVVGVQRGERQYTNPGPDFLLQPGDILLVVGAPKALARFRELNGQGEVQELSGLINA